LVADRNGGIGILCLFVSINAVSSLAFGIGITRSRKMNPAARTIAVIVVGLILFVINSFLVFFAGATMYGV
jgi:hypothetical protein